jgi:outer membrane cobalamin receptor
MSTKQFLARILLCVGVVTVPTDSALAQVTGALRVTVRDAQNLPIANADVALKSATSTWTQNEKASSQGEALFPAVPVGQYVVTVTFEGFSPAVRQITVASNVVNPLSMQLAIAGLTQEVNVPAPIQTINPESSRTETLIQRRDILREAGVDQTGSMAMITNNAPGAYMLHDHLHSRGGHGVSWEIDGVPVPSSAMAATGAQFDPKDVDSLEINRGGLSTSVGDRPYGVFNVIPRSGFEGSRFGDVTATYGSYQTGNLHIALGDHSEDQRWAYFASGSANRTDLGLERVDLSVLHDNAMSFSGFTSIMYNRSVHDQIRFVSAARSDRYQVPNIVEQQRLGIDDHETGTDSFTTMTWLHSTDARAVLTIAPYFHFNRQQYLGGPNDALVTTDHKDSSYIGGYVSWAQPLGKHTLRLGTDAFAEHDDSIFSLRETIAPLRSAQESQVLWSSVAALFAEDSYRATAWLTVNAGVRFQHFQGSISEHATTPRIGVAANLPGIGVLRGSYSRYYEHPPTSTISGPVLDFALTQGFGFLPVRGEHDEVWEVGLGMPIRGWTIDVDAYRNDVENLQDHDVLENSNLLLPLTIAKGRVRAFESTLRSPKLFKRLELRYAFAYQRAQGRGAITGGMTDFEPPPNNEYFFLDHDQLVTFNSGATLDLPRGFWASATVLVGSGFLLGDGPDHLPSHTMADLAFGKTINDKLALRLSGTNVANSTYFTGFDNAFAGTHYGAPRQVSAQLTYRFHY